MTKSHFGWAVGLSLLAIAAGSVRWQAHAQVRKSTQPDETKARAGVSVPEAMLRPGSLPFSADVSLEEIVAHMRRVLKAPVVFDRAALSRHNLTPEITVKCDPMEGVSLRTCLKMLFGQVGLTARYDPSDNLVVVTDAEGAEDPIPRILDELKSIHRDIHRLQDAVDDMSGVPIGDEPGGPVLRKPTIIEQLPDGEAAPAPKDKKDKEEERRRKGD